MFSNSLKAFTIFLIMMILMRQTICQSDLFSYKLKRQGATKYCGRHLANALQLVCGGLYNDMFKKSGQALETEDYQYYDGSPFRSRQLANDLMYRLSSGRFRRESRGVHDECCRKSCTINEMLSYCAPSR